VIQASSDQTAEGCGRSQPRSASPSTEGNRPSDRGERSERWKGQLENVSGTATGGIAGVQLLNKIVWCTADSITDGWRTKDFYRYEQVR